ncbi:acyl-CoA desaturase [Pollutibacter soli]|uniref:fatty acid desaturase family protein n=1 Tax=Pollutibacter soli TaxID=3034157 RepID=UPI003013A5BA
MHKVTFNNKSKVFFNALKASVDQYFEDNKIRKTGNWKLYLKSLILLPLATGLYFLLLFVPMHWALAVTLCAILGVAMASIGFNVMHDACHGSFSTRSWVNETFGLTNNFLGGNAFLWKLKHNIVHHTYTNIDGIDDDINNMPFMRECSTQPWKPMHKYQSYYMFILYGFTSVFMFFMDYVKYFSRKVYTTPINKMDRKEHIIFWIGKLFFIAVYIVVPILMVGWLKWFIGFVIVQFSLGLTLALVFQLAHVVEHAEFDAAGIEPKKIENEWAIHQVKTTANFASRNKIVTWMVGGLNYQIEHHLFPRISHIHYPAISKIVQETCEKFDLRYNYFPTTRSAIASHFRFMKEMGQRPMQPVLAHQ